MAFSHARRRSARTDLEGFQDDQGRRRGFGLERARTGARRTTAARWSARTRKAIASKFGAMRIRSGRNGRRRIISSAIRRLSAAKTFAGGMGEGYAQALWAAHPHMNESADFVMYWWDRAAELLTRKGTRLKRFGFVTTNSIKPGLSTPRHGATSQGREAGFAVDGDCRSSLDEGDARRGGRAHRDDGRGARRA